MSRSREGSGMSAQEIKIPYKSWANGLRTGLAVLLPSFWIFGAIIWFWSISICSNQQLEGQSFLKFVLRTLDLPVTSRSAEDFLLYGMLLLCAIPTIGIPILRSISIATDICITADTFSLPFAFIASMHGRLHRLWRDVSQLTVIASGNGPLGSLAVFFKTGGRAVIDLNKIPGDQLEQLLLALEMRSEQASKSPSFEALLDYVHNQKTGQGAISFTQIWEQDMNRRFGPAAFVPFEPGQTLQEGKFKIIRQLAIGGLSAVYLAQRPSGERVILKESGLPRENNSTLQSKAEDLLKREALFLMRLSHPQIVQVQDFFMDDGKAYLVLEYLPGENLRQIVKQNGPISQEQAIEWAKQLCEILEYLHQQNPPIVHRDISPDNIIAGKDGRLVLIDFGAANEFLTTATGTIVGKQAYLPPEQIKGKAVPQSDIYALGATLFFLLTGKDPEPLSQLHAMQTTPALNPELDRLIYDCTSLDLEHRVQSAEEVLNRLEQEITPIRISLNSINDEATVIKCKQKVVQ